MSLVKKILFLGYNSTQTRIISELVRSGCSVTHSDEKITSTSGYDLVISFGYKHIISQEVLESSKCYLLNLHISYLPWNRGMHPNFWSFYDNTPSGVSIHFIDKGVDTGDILYQKQLSFDIDNLSFRQTYHCLLREIEDLFLLHLEEILNNEFIPLPQVGSGSYHKATDLPTAFTDWDAIIAKEIIRLKKLKQ